MKKLILYASLVIILILALISFRFGKSKGTDNIQVLDNKKEIEETTGGMPVFPMEQKAEEQSSLFENKPAITIIKGPVKKSFSLDQDEKKAIKRRIPEPESSTSFSSLEAERDAGEDISGSSSLGGERGAAEDISEEIEDESAGITIIDKYPPEAEMEEMNERGIVIY